MKRRCLMLLISTILLCNFVYANVVGDQDQEYQQGIQEQKCELKLKEGLRKAFAEEGGLEVLLYNYSFKICEIFKLLIIDFSIGKY